MTIDLRVPEWTYGAELEWPDVDSTATLPDGWAWSKTDYTIVNSDGTANDPRGKVTTVGGEANTPPVASPAALGAEIAPVWTALAPGFNYRSNLHVHVRIPDITLAQVKRIAEFTRAWLPGMLPRLDPLDMLLVGHAGQDRAEAYHRMQHSERSRHYFIPEHRHLLRMRSIRIEDALAAEVPADRSGRPMWHLAPREAVNLRALRKHGTIEFRCFAAPREPDEVMIAAEFAQDWLVHALLDSDPRPLLDDYEGALPRQARFDPALERGWRETRVKS